MFSEQPMMERTRYRLRTEGWPKLALRAVKYLARQGAAASRKPFIRGGFFVPSVALSHYVALHDFAASLEALREKRRWVQERRVRTDAELLPLFHDPLRPTWDDRSYVRFYTWLTRTLGLTERFPPAA
jgi:hypothetical protein